MIIAIENTLEAKSIQEFLREGLAPPRNHPCLGLLRTYKQDVGKEEGACISIIGLVLARLITDAAGTFSTLLGLFVNTRGGARGKYRGYWGKGGGNHAHIVSIGDTIIILAVGTFSALLGLSASLEHEK